MNDEKKLWFKAKRFGWGWTPITWEGWVLTFIYLAGLVHYATKASLEHSASDFLISFAFDFIILSTPFLIVCYLKGEHPHWNWHKETEDKKDTQAHPEKVE
ncbi:hypothetical protein KW800_01565 [Candidatus Parcubacteria bacterium]|nr:hypothetical protein [Candidatus Parcubacteria bacterium]